MSELGLALSSSFAALCLSRIGLTQNDDRLVQQGRSQYVAGLNALQEGLNTPGLAFQDRTLAAMRTLSIYEVHERLAE